MALIAAMAGLIVFILVLYFGKKIKNPFLRYGAYVVGIGFGLVIIGQLAGDTETATNAGQVLVVLIIIVSIINSVVKRFKRKPDSQKSES